MKKLVSVLMVLLMFASCKVYNVQGISIKNTSKINYEDKVVSLSLKKIKERYPWLNESNFRVVNSKTGLEIPFQLEYCGEKNPINLLVQLSIQNIEKVNLVFLEEKSAEFQSKTYGRFVPERADDFTWENDKIAFRVYGKALEETPQQNAFGIDVWVKRTDKMVINERYKRGKYHDDQGDGMDYYHVGYTLGAGNCAPFVKDSIWYSKNYTKYEILDNGPLRTTFKLYFNSWNVDGKIVNATKTISLDAGSQLNKMEVNYSTDSKENIPVVIGIIKREEEGKTEMDLKNGILGYWEPNFPKYGTTGVGIIIPMEVSEMKLRKDQYLAFIKVPVNKPFVYYTGASWDRAGKITSDKEWFNYLKNYRYQLAINGLKISY